MKTRQERIDEIVRRHQCRLTAEYEERIARGERITGFESMKYSACPHIAELIVNLEDELTVGLAAEVTAMALTKERP